MAHSTSSSPAHVVFGFVVDRLAAVVLVLVTGIALMVQVFAVRYFAP